MTEHVMIVQRADFFGGRWHNGFVPLDAEAGTELLSAFEAHARFEPRDTAEQQPAWKQLIPYCVVTRGRDVFYAQRLEGQGDPRLWRRISIGFGGHVGDEDAPPQGAVQRALHRELREELSMTGASGGRPMPRLVGLLNDERDDVGRVHAGLVYRLHVAADCRVEVREVHKLRGGFAPLAALRGHASGEAPRVAPREGLWEDRASIESWSAIVLRSGLWRTPEADREGSVSEDPRREDQE
ncbi:MAG: hypothetical protein AAF628_34285 [Planctomycetota bacterium]